MTETALAPNPRKTLADLLEKAIPELDKVASRHLDTRRMTMIALLTATKQPQLLKCNPKTVVQSLMQAAEMGLEIGGGFGHAYLVPFKETCTLIVGYQGFIELTLRTEFVVDIRAVVVFKGEDFEYQEGTKPFIRHIPSEDVDRRYENVRAAYAVATLKGGEQKALLMWRKEIDLIKSRAKSAKAEKSPWNDAYDSVEMARKCPVRKMAKFLPKSRELATALALDDADEGYLDGEVLVGGEAPVAKASDTAKDRLRRKVKPAEVVAEKKEETDEELDARLDREEQEVEARQKREKK